MGEQLSESKAGSVAFLGVVFRQPRTSDGQDVEFALGRMSLALPVYWLLGSMYPAVYWTANVRKKQNATDRVWESCIFFFWNREYIERVLLLNKDGNMGGRILAFLAVE